MNDIPLHHFIYGMTEDFVTGDQLVDTDDERYRQKLGRFLVEEKGWPKKSLETRLKIDTLFANNFVVSTIDVVVSLHQQRFFILRYAPGSLVTRERSAIAAARVLGPDHQIPYAVVTNGEDAELLDVATGQVLTTGLNCIPSQSEALESMKTTTFLELPRGKSRERELRILNSYDVEICCAGGPCVLPNAPEG